MQGALGISGTEGTFRAAAEATLHALRCSSTAQSEMLLSHCQEASLIWSAAHHESALAKVLKSIRYASFLGLPLARSLVGSQTCGSPLAHRLTCVG